MKFILLVNIYEKYPDVKATAHRREKQGLIFLREITDPIRKRLRDINQSSSTKL